MAKGFPISKLNKKIAMHNPKCIAIFYASVAFGSFGITLLRTMKRHITWTIIVSIQEMG